MYDFKYNLHSAVIAYRNFYQGSLVWYHNIAKPRSDDIVVNHYNHTRYVAVDSKNDIQEYRTSLVTPLRQVAINAQTILNSAFGNMKQQVVLLVNTPLSEAAYLFLSGIGVLKGYDNNERPTLKQILGLGNQLNSLASGTTFNRLRNYTGDYFNILSRYANHDAPHVNNLIGVESQTTQLANVNVFQKLVQFTQSGYSNWLAVQNVKSQLVKMTEPNIFQRLLSLSGELYPKLVESTTKDAISILDLIADKFIEWFIDRLYDWLVSE